MRWRLLAAFVGLAIAVLTIQDIPLFGYLRTVETYRQAAELERDAFLIAGRSENSLEDPLHPGIDDPARPGLEEVDEAVTAYASATGFQVTVVDRNRNVVAASPAETPWGDTSGERHEVSEALAGATTSGTRPGDGERAATVYVAVPVFDGEETIGAVTITEPAHDMEARIGEQLKGLGTVALLTLVAASVIALLMSLTITRPLLRLRLAARSLAGGNLDSRADSDQGPPEVRDLGRDFNTMADRLEELVAAQRAFAADASHQLRTPLTALRLRLDEAVSQVASDPDAAAGALEAAGDEAERLQRLINGLLRLARTAGAHEPQIETDIADVVRARALMWEPLAAESDVRLVVSVPETAKAIAIEGAAEQILDNYLDNALSVAPPGSQIEINVTTSSDTVEMSVDDEGPGLSESERARAFDRFWRADASRPGTGLGLAIVARLAQASGARVWLDRSSSGGARAVAAFARASAQD